MKPEDQEKLESGERIRRKAVFPMGRVKIAEELDDEGRRLVKGYASVFGNRDADGDIVVRGAFERSLRERQDVKVLWMHDTHQPIGKQVQGHEDEYGLAVVGALSQTDFVEKEAMPLLKDGVVNGLSIGYEIVDGKASPDGFLLTDLELFEWSPVTFAANELAQVTAVKSLAEESRLDTHTQIVQRHAKTLLHEMEGFFGHSDRRDALECEELDQLVALHAGKQRGNGTEAADARDSRDQWFYDRGVQDCLELQERQP